jgi:DNA-binding transcriptional ArsR family regulator
VVQYPAADQDAFAAIADPVRRQVLQRLSTGDASITELAEAAQMSLTGMKKHVQVLERSGLVVTQKVGRVRRCRLGPRRLDTEAAWLDSHRQMLEARYDRLGEFLGRTEGGRS